MAIASPTLYAAGSATASGVPSGEPAVSSRASDPPSSGPSVGLSVGLHVGPPQLPEQEQQQQRSRAHQQLTEHSGREPEDPHRSPVPSVEVEGVRGSMTVTCSGRTDPL